MSIYQKLARPVLFGLNPESAHHLAFSTGKLLQKSKLSTLVAAKKPGQDLAQEVLGLKFTGPVGIAAGFDKSAELLPLISELGFGFAEAGSVTNQPSKGNPKPRMFRLPKDKALINRLGLNNPGPDVFLDNLSNFSKESRSDFPVGINVAKTHSPEILGDKGIEDIVSCVSKVQEFADFLVINVSCPNTAEGKTFEEEQSLENLLSELSKVRGKGPLLVKFSPDTELSLLEKLVEQCERQQVSGYVLCNTSQSRAGLNSSKTKLEEIGPGGLSGAPLFDKSIERVRHVYKQLEGQKPIIGLGGIDSGQKAWSYLQAGASLVELYSGLVYEGPWLVDRINKELSQLLKNEGCKNIKEIIGSGVTL